MKSSFDGEIPEIPGIFVDNFESTIKRAYFLSHCHADHICGLNKLLSKIESARISIFIYMSHISAAIVKTHVESGLERFIVPLQLGRETIQLPAMDDLEEMYVSVTTIPAGHCFGSVMFLFETPLMKVLYTGDFRISENSVSKMGQLHDESQRPIHLDVMYVDTTFQDKCYTTFPKRSEVMDDVVREIKSWLAKGEEYKIGLETSARYGYEYVFNEIYTRLGMKVFSDNNWDLYKLFLDKLPGVTDDITATTIHHCSRPGQKQYCTICSNESTTNNTLYFFFTARKFWRFNPEDSTLRTTPDGTRKDVCFATHCSSTELVHFVEYLSPARVVGFEKAYLAPGPVDPVTPTKRKTPVKIAERDESPNKVPKLVLMELFSMTKKLSPQL